MFTTVSVYLLLIALIFWSYTGYILALILFACVTGRSCGQDVDETQLPRLLLLIPCLNEAGMVARKAANIAALDYPADKLAVIFVCSRSSDGTEDAIRQQIQGRETWRLLETALRGKIPQLNLGLAQAGESADVIVCTDMDAELEPQALRRMAAEFVRDPEVGLVGANIRPDDCVAMEQDYWQAHNIMRILESEVFTSSIVVAPCYAFRRGVIECFPEDCVADDIYVAFETNTRGYKTKYLAEAHGCELRTPHSGEEFLRHKFRKGNAYLIELLRFLYRLPQMAPAWKVIYLTKLVQMAIMPWVLPYFALSTLSLLLSGWAMARLAVYGNLFLALAVLAASWSIKWYRSTRTRDAASRNRSILLPFVVSNLILVVVGVSYPFFRQSSSYQRLHQKR